MTRFLSDAAAAWVGAHIAVVPADQPLLAEEIARAPADLAVLSQEAPESDHLADQLLTSHRVRAVVQISANGDRACIRRRHAPPRLVIALTAAELLATALAETDAGAG